MLRFTANLSMLFTEKSLPERFRAAAEQGFSAVEIQFPYTLSVSRIHQELVRNKLQLILFNVAAADLMQGGEGLACVPERQHLFRTAVAQTVAYAEKLKPAVINVLPGRCSQPDRRTEYLHTFKENLLYAAQTFSQMGVKTVFEAVNTYDMPNFLIHSGDQMLEIIQELDHPGLAMQYDLYHMARMGEDTVKFISRHAAKIGHIQFADNPGRGQPGTGAIKFKPLFSAIEKSVYDGWLGAEYHPTGRTENSLNWFK